MQSHIARKKRRCSPALNAFPNRVRNAQGRIKIESVGPVEIMDVIVEGLPPNTDLDFFVVQIQNAGFGLSWYGAISRLIVMASAMAGSSAASILRPSSCRPQASLLGSRFNHTFPDESRSYDWTDPHLPPGSMVQLRRGCQEGRRPRHRDPFLRRAQRRCPSAQYQQFPRSRGTTYKC